MLPTITQSGYWVQQLVERQIFSNAHCGHYTLMDNLENCADALTKGVLRTVKTNTLAVNPNFPFVILIVATNDLDQSGFASSIRPHEGKDLSWKKEKETPRKAWVAPKDLLICCTSTIGFTKLQRKGDISWANAVSSSMERKEPRCCTINLAMRMTLRSTPKRAFKSGISAMSATLASP